MSPARWLLTILAWCALGAQASVHISPTTLTLTERQPVEVLTLTNRGDKATTFEVRTYRWQQPDGTDQLEPTRELLASPPVFSLQPGESQTVRVALNRKFPDTTEFSYRAIFREVPTPRDPGSAIGLQVALEIRLPVFATPAAAAPSDIRWHATLDKNADLIITAKNHGARHAKFTELNLTDSSGKALTKSWRGIGYVLPGTSSQWRFTPQMRQRPGATLVIDTKSGRQAHHVRVPVE